MFMHNKDPLGETYPTQVYNGYGEYVSDHYNTQERGPHREVA